MSLLQSISNTERNEILAFPLEKCEFIIEKAKLRTYITKLDRKDPGKQLLKALNRSVCSLDTLNKICEAYQYHKLKIYYKPQCKIAVLIANQKYQYYTELFTPIPDCETLKSKFVGLGFITVLVTNNDSEQLKTVLKTIYSEIPEDSYVFTYYAGHGCQICNVDKKYINCILGIECPTEFITLDNCVTENFVLQELSNAKPELGIFMMDMCRLDLDRENNRTIYENISSIPEYTIHKNLIITYSTESSASAFENIECNPSVIINTNESYVKQPGDTGRVRPTSSEYGHALKNRLTDYSLDINSLIDQVHIDVEKSQKQKPLKLLIPSDMPKYSLYDPVYGDISQIADNLQGKLADLDLLTSCSVHKP